MSGFDHERLDVYAVAIDFVVLANEVVERLPRGRGYLADQLQRAATSIPRNIAEGAGEYSGAEKARFYRIARRSGTECAAILDREDRPPSVTGHRHGHGHGHVISQVLGSSRTPRCDERERRAPVADGDDSGWTRRSCGQEAWPPAHAAPAGCWTQIPTSRGAAAGMWRSPRAQEPQLVDRSGDLKPGETRSSPHENSHRRSPCFAQVRAVHYSARSSRVGARAGRGS